MPFHKRVSRNERGQAAIFMALFFSTMILLFAFTTNVGMLVHAKINLQNAADAAAYAGAAVQARQLTAAAYLNWEMRRALKEFLFYTSVRSQYAAMPCFPLDAQGSVLPICPAVNPEGRHDFRLYDPREARTNELPAPPGKGYVPSTCIIFKAENNYCQKAGVPGIPEFPSGGGWGVADPIVAAVRSATNQIISKKTEDCEGRTELNRKFLIAWLFALEPRRNMDPFFSAGDDIDDPFPFANGLERIGILPRMAMLRARIDNIEEALNLNLSNEGVGSVTVTDQTMGQLRGLAPGPYKTLDYFERPIQAFLSARNNLPSIGEDNGNFAQVELTELLPNRVGSVEINGNLRNPPVLAKFIDLKGRATFANSLFRQINPADTSTGGRGNCYQFREARVISQFPFGVTKDPSVLTYYAVRLEAKARLLFSPFGGNGVVTLSAYSAAKPFGSRIGKNLNPEDSRDGALKNMMGQSSIGRSFSATGGGTITDFVDLITGLSPTYPNVLIKDGDTNSNDMGFNTNEHLGYLRQAVISLQRADFGPRLAGAYAPWEIGYYTPPANFQEGVIGKFEDNPTFNGKTFSLVAPLFPVNGNNGGDLRFIKERVLGYMVGDADDALTTSGAEFAPFLNYVMGDDKFADLTAYMGDSRETVYHYIPDPLLTDEPDLQAYARAVGQKFTVAGMTDPYKRQLTSWNNQKTASDGPEYNVEPNSELGLDMGRSGYSVRFLSFASLRAGGRATNDPDQVGIQWSNPFDRFDAGSSAARIFDDINKLKH
jgi:hypothetical protein